MADELAGQGFIVVAPDLLTGFGPNNGNSDSFPSMDATTKAVSGLDPAVVNADLDAAADYGKKIPAGNGKIASVGFCWGGGKSFAFAAHRKDLSAAFVFYGPGPSDVTTITAQSVLHVFTPVAYVGYSNALSPVQLAALHQTEPEPQPQPEPEPQPALR